MGKGSTLRNLFSLSRRRGWLPAVPREVLHKGAAARHGAGHAYQGMAIANGGDAQLAFTAMAAGQMDRADIEKTREALKLYCGQVTMAMVKILKKLYTLIVEVKSGRS